MQLFDAEGRRLYVTEEERRAFVAAAAKAPREVRTRQARPAPLAQSGAAAAARAELCRPSGNLLPAVLFSVDARDGRGSLKRALKRRFRMSCGCHARVVAAAVSPAALLTGESRRRNEQAHQGPV